MYFKYIFCQLTCKKSVLIEIVCAFDCFFKSYSAKAVGKRSEKPAQNRPFKGFVIIIITIIMYDMDYIIMYVLQSISVS